MIARARRLPGAARSMQPFTPAALTGSENELKTLHFSEWQARLMAARR
jgi:hypothetical protein